MPGGAEKKERKEQFFGRLLDYVDKYPVVFLIGADNVGSLQMQQVRKQLRPLDAHMLMGKNTMVRKALRGHLESNPDLEALMNLVYGNVGFVFAKTQLGEVKKVILANKVGAPAKIGVISPIDVVIPAGPTGLDPQKTANLQALNVATKINKGQIEIVKDHVLIKTGQKIGSSEVSLLSLLNIKPFQYGLTLLKVYDSGSVYDPEILDMSDNDLAALFSQGIRNVAAVSLAINFPTLASAPHVLFRGYKNVLAISVGTDYTYEQSKKVKELLSNPEALKAAQAASAPAAAPAAKEAPKEAKKEVKKEEKKEEEEEVDMGLSLFD